MLKWDIWKMHLPVTISVLLGVRFAETIKPISVCTQGHKVNEGHSCGWARVGLGPRKKWVTKNVHHFS